MQSVVNPNNPNNATDPHVYGKAADIATGPNGTNGSFNDWTTMKVAAKSAGACVEPYQEQGVYLYHYIHVDWGRTCPAPDRLGFYW